MNREDQFCRRSRYSRNFFTACEAVFLFLNAMPILRKAGISSSRIATRYPIRRKIRRGKILIPRPLSTMLGNIFSRIYTKFKLEYYQRIFTRQEDREASLTTVEAFCMPLRHHPE